MTLSLNRNLERLRSHILFLPALLALAAVVLAVGLVELDRTFDEEVIRRVPWMFRAGASGAREVLSTIATAMVQLAAITFSVTIVTLALRSQQFGPRLLRNFTGDQVNQAILGAFVATFIYCLLVLRAVRDLDDAALEEETFIPFIAVTVAILLALVSLALFVVFIDRVVTSIQADTIIVEVADETRKAIGELFPQPLGEERAEPESDFPSLVGAREIPAPGTGYVQQLDSDALMRLAREADLVLRMEAPIGGFVVEGTPLLTGAPGERVDDALCRKLQRAFTIGRHRSTGGDPEFGIRQIVDVAVKALSPSDNDPTTAVTAIEYLGALLIDLAARSIPSSLRHDEEGELRIIALGPTFRRVADLAIDQIREHGKREVAVVHTLLETIIRLAGAVRTDEQRAVLEEHVWKISRAADGSVEDPIDRDGVNQRLQLAMERLGREEAGGFHYLLPLTRG